MTTYRQINYIKIMLSKASRKTKQEFEDKILLNKETPDNVISYWMNRLEKELGIAS